MNAFRFLIALLVLIHSAGRLRSQETAPPQTAPPQTNTSQTDRQETEPSESRPEAGESTSDDPDVTDAPEQADPSPILLVIGAGGTPEYAEQFEAWADQWLEVADKSGAVVTEIGRDESESSDREQLQKAIGSLTSRSPVPAWIVLIGHGTFARDVAKFNLKGRDVSARELAEWLGPIERPLVLVDCASASGPFVNRLSGPNRVIVTATKSGVEQNYARFGKYFAEAISADDSDLDHDDEVSVHEAFLRASASVRQFYESEARISTEHALIDDNGDGRGTPANMFRGTRPIAQAKDGAQLDGAVASKITLALNRERLVLTNEEVKQRDQIEKSLASLRLKKPALAPSQYDDQLESLLLRMAWIYQAAELRASAK